MTLDRATLYSHAIRARRFRRLPPSARAVVAFLLAAGTAVTLPAGAAVALTAIVLAPGSVAFPDGVAAVVLADTCCGGGMRPASAAASSSSSGSS